MERSALQTFCLNKLALSTCQLCTLYQHVQGVCVLLEGSSQILTLYLPEDPLASGEIPTRQGSDYFPAALTQAKMLFSMTVWLQVAIASFRIDLIRE